MDALLAFTMFAALVWVVWLCLPKSPRKPKPPSPYKPGYGPIDEQRLTNSLLMVLILTLAGRDHD